MCAEVARQFEPPLNGGNPGPKVRTGRTVIVLLAAVGLLAVFSPLGAVVLASPASATTAPTITLTTQWSGAAMGGERLGFTVANFPPTQRSPGPSWTTKRER